MYTEGKEMLKKFEEFLETSLPDDSVIEEAHRVQPLERHETDAIHRVLVRNNFKHSKSTYHKHPTHGTVTRHSYSNDAGHKISFYERGFNRARTSR